VGARSLRAFRQLLNLGPQPLEAFGPQQLLQRFRRAEVGVQFLGDEPAQFVEAIVAIRRPAALSFQKLLGGESPCHPFISLADHRLPSVLEALDPGAQCSDFSLKTADAIAQVFH